MPNDRTVGKPAPNKEFMRPRDVSVQKNKPNLNDNRKVRPHTVDTPQLGVRPTGGAQKAAKAPPDKLGGDYIGAREVPMKTMTEAELTEWPFSSNPFARMFNSSQPTFHEGDAIGFKNSDKGMQLVHVVNGVPKEVKNIDTHQTITNKMKELNAQYAALKQQRQELYINPRNVFKQESTNWARELGLDPVKTKFGRLYKDIPINHENPASPDATPDATPAPTPEPQRRERGYYGTPYPKPFNNVRHQWDKRSGKVPGGTPNNPSPGRPPTPQPINPSQPESTNGSEPEENGDLNFHNHKSVSMQDQPMEIIDQILAAGYSSGKDKFWTPERIKTASPLNKRQAALKIVSGKIKANSMGESVHEAYPDSNYEHGGEPFGQGHIGDQSWEEHLRKHPKSPTPPDVNREFIQARDISVERVTELAEQGIEEMLSRTLARLGEDYDWRVGNTKRKKPESIPDTAPEDDRYAQAQRREKKRAELARNSKVPRTRARWA